ncbi:MAG: hypothetical protein HOC91_08460 [Nitrospinaceae bacterium]|nr:hypothetical protein [Nitrospinaceae bacterium]MBT4092628.1 hypothetical protein [Nitrospinaceae bacterium]MBT4430529.1 hypothetical protein [Nitrospinaceae bacterium]MBT5369354.1 hypothetical protein [Nitrospinaceae bacterium]MBT5947173.1 hypothetical protein [Nitrospinaceae bacterium]
MRLTFGVVLTAVIVLLLSLSAGGFYYTSSSKTCGTCHEMQTMYVSWQNSGHDQVQCMQCHSDPGFVGQIKAKMQGAKRLISHFRGKFDYIKATVDNEICLQCHADFKDNDKKVALSSHPLVATFPVHQSHEALKLQCNDCHSRMVHGALYRNLPVTVENCRNCHEERGVLNPSGLLPNLIRAGRNLQPLLTKSN